MSRSKKMKAMSSEADKTSLGMTIYSLPSSTDLRKKKCENQGNPSISDILKEKSEILKTFSYKNDDITIVLNDKYSSYNLNIYFIPLNKNITDGKYVFDTKCKTDADPTNDDDACCNFEISGSRIKDKIPTDKPIVSPGTFSFYNDIKPIYIGTNYDIYVQVNQFDSGKDDIYGFYIRAPV